MSIPKHNTLNPENFASSLQHLIGERKSANRRSYSILVALSGGPDSVALLHLLHKLAGQEGFRIAAAHLNYGLRGAESDGDEQFCIELCRKLGIKLYRRKVSLNRKRSVNVQDWARAIRFKFFDHLCLTHSFDFVALGHNSDDNVETILMNLFRGAGTSGISGMTGRSGTLIRPLLEFTREDILNFLGKNKLDYRTDSSNLESKYTRNRVRLELLPEVDTIFGTQSRDNVLRAAQIHAEQQDYLREQAQKALARVSSTTPFGKIVFDLKRLRRYHSAIRRLLMALTYERLTGSLRGFEYAASSRALSLLDAEKARLDFLAHLFCEVGGGKLYVYKRVKAPAEIPLKMPGVNDLEPFGIMLRATVLEVSKVRKAQIRKGGESVFLDRDRIPGKLRVRAPRAGDRFQPLGLAGTKKLSDFFVDRKIDRPLREERPLVVSGRKIVWVVGYQIDDACRVTDLTRNVLNLEVSARSR
jgi:tRNA(Ile)-lysidine synthase